MFVSLMILCLVCILLSLTFCRQLLMMGWNQGRCWGYKPSPKRGQTAIEIQMRKVKKHPRCIEKIDFGWVWRSSTSIQLPFFHSLRVPFIGLLQFHLTSNTHTLSHDVKHLESTLVPCKACTNHTLQLDTLHVVNLGVCLCGNCSSVVLFALPPSSSVGFLHASSVLGPQPDDPTPEQGPRLDFFRTRSSAASSLLVHGPPPSCSTFCIFFIIAQRYALAIWPSRFASYRRSLNLWPLLWRHPYYHSNKEQLCIPLIFGEPKWREGVSHKIFTPADDSNSRKGGWWGHRHVVYAHTTSFPKLQVVSNSAATFGSDSVDKPPLFRRYLPHTTSKRGV
jgi:hypothetical protein